MDYAYQKELFVVNWAQIHKQSLVATVYRGLSGTLRKKPGFLELYFEQWAETCPVQSEQPSYILMCIFIDLLEQLYNNQ